MQPSVSEVLKVLQAVKERKNLSVETLVRQFDSNGDDRLTFLEFQKMLNALSLDLDESTAREVFRHLDVDGDRQLSLRTLSQLQSGQRTSNETRPSSPSGHSVAEVLKALQAIKEERKLSVETLIRLFDSDGDDKLTYAEFQALLGTLSIDAEESVAREVFAKLDLDGDGQLSLNTLNALQSAQPSQGLPHQTLPGEDSVADVLKVLQTIQERKKVSVEALIQMFDSDSDGKLTFGEFQKMLSALHLNVEEGTAKEAFAKLDLDGDGQLSLKTLRSLQSLQGTGVGRLAHVVAVLACWGCRGSQAIHTVKDKDRESARQVENKKPNGHQAVACHQQGWSFFIKQIGYRKSSRLVNIPSHSLMFPMGCLLAASCMRIHQTTS